MARHVFSLLTGLAVLLLGVCRAEPAEAPGDGFQYPVDVAVAAEGVVYVADLHLPGIWKVTAQGCEKFVVGQQKHRTPLAAIRCLAVDPQGRLLAGDSATREVYRIDASGQPVPLTGGKVGTPMGLAVRADGEILVSDLELNCVWKIPADGGPPIKLAAITAPSGIALDAQDRLWVISRRPPQLCRVDRDGSVTPAVKERVFAFPQDVAVGGDGTVLVTDGYGACVWQVGPDGKATKLVQGKPLVNPVGIAIDNGRTLICDSRARAVFVWSAGKLTPLVPQ